MYTMKTKLLLFALLVLSLYSCTSMLKVELLNKKKTIRIWEKAKKKESINYEMEETKNCVKIRLRDKRYSFLDETSMFDNKGKQVKYTCKSYCDSCFKGFVSTLLANRIYRWTKLTDSTYITSYDNKLLLSIHEYDYSYEIVKFSFTKAEYKELIRKR